MITVMMMMTMMNMKFSLSNSLHGSANMVKLFEDISRTVLNMVGIRETCVKLIQHHTGN